VTLTVAVLGGGRSSEHDVSLASARAVREGLAAAGHEVIDVLVGRDGSWSCGSDPVTIVPGGGLLGADAVFPALHGPFGEDGTVQGLLETVDVPYVGAGVLASALCMDKLLFKDVMARAGVPQVDYAGVRRGDRTDGVEALGFPLFVKPARLGSSVGISKVEAPGDLARALEHAFQHDPLVIAEAMARGMEVECAVLGNGDPAASEPGEIVLSGGWYDYEAKYTPGGMELVVPARLSGDLRRVVQELALETFVRVGCAGLARVDFFVEEDGRVLVNELNTMPGFTPTSVYAKLWERSGVPYPELCDRLVRLGRERHQAERTVRF
jgi:D-alanine-D-alanine ligase